MTPSFDEIYRQLRVPVLRLCLGVTGDRAAAEDAAQETFLAVYRALGAFRGEAKVSTWFYRVAVRAALRARSRRDPAMGGDAAEPASAPPHVALEARDEVRRLGHAMQRLPSEQRLVLTLFAIDGLGHREIAELLGVPEGTVWSRLHLARRRLGEELEH